MAACVQRSTVRKTAARLTKGSHREIRRPRNFRSRRRVSCSRSASCRLSEKRAAYCDTVKATGQLAFFPSFDRMRVAELMQTRVALDDLVIDPRIFPFRAGIDHF